MNTRKLFQYLVNPGFLTKIDKTLLLNYPWLWSTRFHYVFYYCMLINLALIALTLMLIQPDQLDELTTYIMIFFAVAELAAFSFWIFKLSIFNLEKEYGNRGNSFRRSIYEISLYFLCVIMMLSPSITVTSTAIYKTAYNLKINESTNCAERTEKSFLNIKEQILSDDEFKEEVRDKAGEICSGIQDFVTRTTFNNYNYYLPFHLHRSVQVTFLSLAVLPLIARYSKMYILPWSALYAIFLAIIDATTLGMIKNTLPKSDENTNLIISLIVIATLLFVHIIILLSRSKKYTPFLPIDLIVLSIVIHVLSIAIGSRHFDPDEIVSSSLSFSLIFIIFLFPFLKKLLVRNLSLPM